MDMAVQGLNREALKRILDERGEKGGMRAQQIFEWLYSHQVDDWQQMTNLPANLRHSLAASLPPLQILQAQQLNASNEMDPANDDPATAKMLWRLHDGRTVESVMIPAVGGNPHHATLCISSQVGCAMQCGFCLTGIQGLDRHLAAAEIVEQVRLAKRQWPISHVVFMGMGEPLHNVDEVIRACRVLSDPYGLNISKRRITVSTSGIVPAIESLGREAGVNLAISLNATTNRLRDQLMPINKKWPIERLLEAARAYPHNRFRRITLEYVLMDGCNVSDDDARSLIRMARSGPFKINLIPFNEHPGASFRRPSQKTIERFFNKVLESGVTVTLRKPRGGDILAACGQLRSQFKTARGTDRHRDEAYRSSKG